MNPKKTPHTTCPRKNAERKIRKIMVGIYGLKK